MGYLPLEMEWAVSVAVFVNAVKGPTPEEAWTMYDT